MIDAVLRILLALVIAVGGGAASVWYALDIYEATGSLKVGAWTADPVRLGGDPYSRARSARDAILPLGPAEGLAFFSDRDSAGRPLSRDCTYRVTGGVPASRFWTLHVASLPGQPVQPAAARSAIHSHELLREESNGFAITVSAAPAPGNWLALSGEGAMRLVLTLYDTSIAASIGISDFDLPRIVRIGCRG